MDRRVDTYVQPGGEGYVKWARAQLVMLRARRRDLRLPSLQKHFQIDSSTRVSIKSTDYGDKIYIFAGSPWDFYGTVVDLDTITGHLFVGTHDKALTVLSPEGTLSWTYATSSLGKSFGLISDDGARKFVDPQKKISAVHDGAYDAYTPSTVIPMAANSEEQAYVAAIGVVNSLVSPSKSLATNLEQSLATLYPMIADPAPGEGQTYTPAGPNFYAFNNHPGGVEPDLKMWGLNEQTLVQSQTNPGDWTVWSAGSLYDAMFTRPDADALNIEYYSARTGFVATRTRYDYGGSGAISQGAMVPLANAFVVFDVERQEQDFGDLNADGDPNTNIRIGVTKLTGEFGASGLAYDSLKAEYNFKAGFGASLGSPEHFRLVGAVATRTVAYAFFLYNTYNDLTGNAYTLRCIGSDGSDTVVDATFPLDAGVTFSTAVQRQEFVVGSTIDTPYLACMDRAAGSPRKVRIYNATGLVHETAALFQAWGTGGKNTLFTNGNTRDHMFFIVKGNTGAEVHLLREDGEIFEINSFLGGRSYVTPSGSTHTTTALTDRNLVYNFVGSPVCHITNKQGDPLAPVVKEYPLPYASYIAAPSVPVRSGIMKLQEFEAWA